MNALRKTLVFFIVLTLFALAVGVASAQTRNLIVETPSVTGKPVPVSLSLDDIRRTVGITFAIDWNSLRVYDSAGQLIPFQIDDVDLSGGVSRDDHLAFVTSGPARIEVAQFAVEELPTFDNAFTVEATEDGWLIESIDGKVAAEVTELGGVNLVRYDGVDRSFAA